MRRIRVLIVDDSTVIRRLLSDALGGDPEIEVAGTAAHGRIALAKIPQVNPDVLILDIEMPEMDGLETLAALRKTYPLLPVIMFSTLTERGAEATLDALSLGANDYVTKPSNVGSVAIAQQRVREELIPKIKLFCARQAGFEVAEDRTPQRKAASSRFHAAPGAPRAIQIVAIGVSTGGPNALAEVLPALPASFPVPIVVVQHMPPVFTRLLAERLDSKSAIRVAEGAQGAELRPGQAWIAPGDFHMVVERDAAGARIRTTQGLPENSCRPAVDVLFRSVVDSFGAATLAVVLTGMGKDGLRGCEAAREAGGQVIVQDEATSVVWGMPGFVARAGLAEEVVPIGDVASRILARVLAGRSAAAIARASAAPR